MLITIPKPFTDPIDSLFLLYFLEKARPFYGRTKIQKVSFLVELKLQESHLVGPHFRFIRYTNGPFSRELWDNYDKLADTGFLTKSAYTATERGRFLLDLAIDPLRRIPRNKAVFEITDSVLEWARSHNGGALIDHVYNLKVKPANYPNQTMTVADVPFGATILQPSPTDSIEVPNDIRLMIEEDLAITDSQLEEERSRLPDLERRAFNNLQEAMNGDPQAS